MLQRAGDGGRGAPVGGGVRLPRSRGRVDAFGFTSWHVLDERGFRVSIDDDDALWKCGNLAAPAQAWSAAIAREISNGLWAPASPTFKFSTTPTGRPQPGHFHSAPWGYAAQSGNAASVSATSGAERSSAAQQARVRFLDEPAGLAAAIRLTKPKASRAPVGHHSPPVCFQKNAGDDASRRRRSGLQQTRGRPKGVHRPGTVHRACGMKTFELQRRRVAQRGMVLIGFGTLPDGVFAGSPAAAAVRCRCPAAGR